MSGISNLIVLIDAYREARKIGDARVSTLVFNDGSRIAQIRDGGDIGTRRLQRAIGWFSDNWPAGADWPVSVPRPAREPEAVAS